jgi:hypothetical protein
VVSAPARAAAGKRRDNARRRVHPPDAVVEEVGYEDIPLPVQLQNVLFIGQLGCRGWTAVTQKTAALDLRQRAYHCANQAVGSHAPGRAKVSEKDISVGIGLDTNW